MSKYILEINKVSKLYNIHGLKENNQSFRESVINTFKRTTKEHFWALKDFSLNVEQGDSIGIIGKNGAGKSTLLKILSRITPPTSGNIISRGRIASLLEVGTGFHGELTGRENVFMNGSILGMKKTEISQNFDAIVDFSGVEKFIDTPLKHYSSGMQLRLAFAVAAFLENEILIIDEVLAVGDSEFQKKCMGKMKDVANSGRTVLFVSHHLGSVKNLCNKGVVLNHGQQLFEGNTIDAISFYQTLHTRAGDYHNEHSDSPVYIKTAGIVNESTDFTSDEVITTEFITEWNEKSLAGVSLLIRIKNAEETVICSSETHISSNQTKVVCTFDAQQLIKGRYILQVILYKPAIAQFDNIETCLEFSILNNIEKYSHLETFDLGSMYLNAEWS